MRIEGKEYRTIWYEESVVKIIDQTKLPHNFVIKQLKNLRQSLEEYCLNEDRRKRISNNMV